MDDVLSVEPSLTMITSSTGSVCANTESSARLSRTARLYVGITTEIEDISEFFING